MTINKSAGGADTISAGIQFNDDLTITNDALSANVLTLSGGMRSILSDVIFAGSGNTTVVTTAIVTGGNLIKNGTGLLNLNVGNTYAGATTINQGTLTVSSTTGLPIRSAVTIASGAIMEVNNAFTIGSLSGSGLVTNTSTTSRILTIGRDDTNTTFSGTISPTTTARVAITKVGAGTLTLAPTVASTYTGNTVINGGAILLDFTAGSLSSILASGSALTIGGGNLALKGRSGATVSQSMGNFTLGASGGSILMDNNGGTSTTLALGTITSSAAGGSLLVSSPANTTVTFNQALNTATTVNGRVVFTDGAGAYNWAANTGVNTATVGLSTYTDVAGSTMAASNTVNSRIDSTVVGEITSVTNPTSTTNSLKINAGASGQSLAIGTNGLVLTSGGLLFTGANNYTISGSTGTLKSNTATNSDLVIHQYGSGTLTISAAIANGIGNSTLTKAGTGKLVLTGTNTFTGGIFINGGTLSFSTVANGAGGLGAGVATAVTIGDGATLQYTGATGTIASGTSAGSHTFALTGGMATIEVTNAATALTFAGAVTGTTGGGFNKTGPGTLVLAATGTYVGPTNIVEGTLQMGNGANGITSSSPVTIASIATLDMLASAGSQTLTVGSIAGSGTIVNSGTSTKTLAVGGNNTSTTFSGIFAAGGAAGNVLTKTGTGTLTLANTTTSAWTGGTNVNGGILRLAVSNALSSTGTMVIANAAGPARLELDPGVAQTLAAITINGSSSAATSQGNIILGLGSVLTLGGTLTVNNNNNPQASMITGAGTVALSATRTFAVNNSTAVPNNLPELTVTVPLTSTGGITKSGNGNMLLSGNNTFTGTLTVGGLGTVWMTGDNIAMTGATTLNAGTLVLDYTAENAVKVGTGALSLLGGELVMNGNAGDNSSHTVASTTFAAGGAATVTLNAGSGQEIVLNLGALTRAVGAGAGTVRFNLPDGIQSATHGVTTTTLNNATTGLLGAGAAFATVTDSSGTNFAINATNTAGGNIVGITSTVSDDVNAWSAGLNATDAGGYTGSLASSLSLNTLRFNAAGASTVTIANGETLTIGSGGILQTSNVTGISSITGGRLTSGLSGDLIFIVDGSQYLDVSSTIAAGDTIAKSGKGTLRLTGVNTSSGTITIQDGTIELTGGKSIADSTSVALLNLGGSPTLSLLAGQTETIGALSGGGSSSSANVLLGASSVLTLNQVSNSTYSGAFTVPANATIIKNGTGTLTYNGNSSVSFAGKLIINGGVMVLSGSGVGRLGTLDIVVNGSELQNLQDQSSSQDRLANTGVVTLNNTAGTNGLHLNASNNGARGDTMGTIALGAGQNVITLNGSGGSSAVGTLTVGNAIPLTRDNNATALVRGRSLGASSGQRGQLILSNAPTGTLAAIGGGGAAATTTISIFPYLIGHSTSGTPGTTELGNTFVMNTGTTNGLRPLSTASGAGAEYIFDQAGYNGMTASSTNNVRFTATPTGSLTAVSGARTINALAIDSTSAAVTVTGPASDSLMLTAGALLSTGASANNTALTGFSGITTNTSEYIVFVTNDRFTLGSPLTTTGAALTKASAGTLVLNGLTNSYTGGTYFNEGAIEINALGALGSGNLNFFGGALRWATGSAFDVSTRTINFGSGGGIFDTNGNNVVLANVFGNNTTGGMTKAGLGSLTLNATPAYTGNTTINGGSLVLGLNQAIPNTGLVLGGGTLNLAGFNASVPTLTLSGADSLITGSGVLTVTGEIIANQGRVDSILSGSANFIKQTAGQTVVLTNALNNYTGYTHIQDGSLSIPSVPVAGVPGYLGNQTGDNATIRLGQGTTTGMLVVTGAGGTINRNFDLVGTTGGGGIDNDGTSAVTLNGTITSTTAGSKSLVLAGDSTGFVNVFAGSFSSNIATLGITKNEASTWSIPGNYTYTGNTVVNGGVLNISGSITGNTTSSTLAYGGNAGNAVVNVSGDMTLFSTTGGNASGAVAVYNQTAGTVTVTPGTGNSQYVARAAGSYGYFNLTGGTYKNSNRWDTNASGSLGSALNTATSSVGVVYVGGTGFLDHTNAEWFINGYSLGQITVAGNGAIDHTGSNNPFAIFMDSTTTGGTYGVLNLAGGTVTVGAQPIRFGNNTTNGSGNTGFVNLAGGTLSVGSAISSSVNASGANNAYLAFSGGTLKFTGSVSSWIPASTAGITYTATLFGAIDNSSVSGAPSFGGGLTVDTNGFNTTLNDSSSVLKGASGTGVTQANLQVTGGSGYVGAPAVVFSTAGVVAGGTPAAGYALISNGAVTGIVITNPGTYTAGTVPTITLSGGGGTGASVTSLPLNTANVSGGLTKTGDGVLTLTGVQTYSGATVVNGGALSVASNVLPNTSSLRVGETGSASFNLYPDGVGSTMTLALNANIILGGTSTGGSLGFQLGTTSDRIQLNGGNLIINAGGGYIDAIAGSGFDLGSYQVITGAASITGTPQLGSLPGGYMYSLSTTSSSVTLNVLSTAASGDVYWTGDVNNSWATLAGGNTNWSLAANGVGDAGFTPGVGNVVNFSASNVVASPITTTLDNNYSIQGLKFLSSTTSGITIAAGSLGSLTLGSDGIVMQPGAAANVAISVPVALSTSQTWTVDDTTSLLSVSGVVSGAGNLTINGGGTVMLSGVNTFTGNVLIDGAGSTLSVAVSQLNNADANSPIGAAGAHSYTLQNGGIFSLSSANTLNPTAASGKSFVIGSGGGTIDVGNASGILQLDDANQFYLTPGTTLTKTGVGTLLLGSTTDANVAASTTVVVNGGTLRLQAAGSLGTTNKSLINLASGTLDIRINSGAILANNVVVTGDSTISTGRTTASNANITQTLGVLVIGNNTLNYINGNGNTAPGVANLTFGNTVLVGTPTFNVNNVNGAGVGTLTLGSVVGTGFGINKTGAGILLMSAGNTYTGPTNVLAGTLQLSRLTSLYNNNLASWTTSNIVVESGATLGVNVGGSGEFTSAELDTLLGLGNATGGFKNGSAIALDTTNAANGHFVYDSDIANTNGGANAIGVTKSGTGTLTLTGTQTYTGPTTITGGALAGNLGVGNLVLKGGVYEGSGTFTSALGTGDGQVQWAVGANGGFSARGGDLTVLLGGSATSLTWDSTANFVSSTGQLLFGSTTSDSTVFFPHSINLNGAVRTIQVVDNPSSASEKTVLSGRLSGVNGGINKTGTGVLELAAANTYTGTTTLTLGTLQLNNASNGGLGSGQLVLTAGTLQALMPGISLTNDVSLTAVTVSGDQSLTLNGTVTGLTGGSRTLTSSINGGTLTLGNVAINTDTASARTLTLAGTGATTINGVISNGNGNTQANSLSITNTGLTTLNGTNTYTGNTTINVGIGSVVLASNGKIGTGNLTVNSGDLTIGSSQDQSVALLTMAGGAAGSDSLITIGTGRKLSVTGVTYSGTNNNLTSVINGAGTLDLGTVGITVNIANSTVADIDMSWEMNTLIGSGLFTKDGAGTLDLRGVTNNNYAATGYQINAGAILGLNAITANLILNGGVYEGSGSFTRALGTGNNQVQWLANGGGFSARGADLSVTLSGAANPLVWGSTTNFVPSGAPLIFGSVTADSAVTFTHNIDLNGGSRTVQVVDNTALTTDLAILPGVISNGSLVKTGTGILRLTGNNTFTGGITITQGTLEFSTVSNNGGAASHLGQGSDGISLGGGILSFIGNVDQSTNRAISVTAASSLFANGTSDASITYTGAITTTANIGLTLGGSGKGIISGGVTVAPPASGTATADITVTGGNWTLTGGATSIADDFLINNGTVTLQDTVVTVNDDIVVTGASTVLNLNTTGVWNAASPSGTSSGLYARGGAVINLNAHDINGAANANGLDFILLADGTTSGTGTLNTNIYNITTPRLDIGSIADGYEGAVLGSGTVTVTYTGNDWLSGIRLFRGSIEADLAGVASILKQGMSDVTLKGDNSGLTATVASRLDSGNLILDYSLDNNSKLSTAAALDMRGGTLTLNGGVLDHTIQNVASFTLANGGANQINVNGTATYTTTLNLGAITRAASAGTIRFVTGLGGVITTTTTNNATTGLLGTGTAFSTINDGTGTYFAINDGANKIVALTYAAAKNDISTWLTGDHVTNAGAGFTGTVNVANINSLRFDAATGSTITIESIGNLTIGSGGILQTENVTTGPTVITGGRLISGTGELVVTTDSTSSSFRISSYLSGTTVLTKAGAGTLILDGSNHYGGNTNLQNGTIQVSGGNAIGDRSVVTLADDHFSTLELLDSETIGSLQGGSATTGLNNLALVSVGSNTLTINQISTTTYAGVISGDGRIVKTGASTLSLSGVNTFTGDLIVNQGQLTLGSRTIANFTNVGSVTLNAGSMLLDFTGGNESSANKINNNAPVTMINTGGIDGLRANNDRNDANKAESIGALTFLGGANTVTVSASNTSGTTQRNMTITAASLIRSNRATLLVRGQNLGTTSTTPGDPIHTGRFVAATVPTLTGGAGAAGTSTLSILPWAIGSNSITGTGNSFITHATTTGFRPLDLSTEYEQLTAAGGITLFNNVRYSSAADLTLDASTARIMNSLFIDNTSTTAGITLAGAGALLNINSGAFLITGTQGVTLSGFSGITTGTSNEYIFHVPNTATAGVTVSSPFTSLGASLTKSGAGTLILTSTGSSYTGPTTVNQGVLQIDSLNKLGSMGIGGLVFNAGVLKFGAAFDVSAAPVTFGVAATSTVETTTGGTFDTNGFNIVLANSIGNGGNGGFTKIGAGTLTLNAVAKYAGATTLTTGTLVYGVSNALPTTTDLTMSASTTLTLGSNSAQLRGLNLLGSAAIGGSAPLTFTGNVLQTGGSYTLTLTNTQATVFDGDYLQLTDTATARTLTLSSTGPVTINSAIIDGPGAASAFTKSGAGTIELTGANVYNGTTTNSTGTMILSGSNAGTGGTTLTSGTLQLNNNNNGGLASGTLTLTTGTVQTLNAARTISNNTIVGGSVTVSGVGLTINGSFTNSGGSRTLTNNTTTGNALNLAGSVYLSEATATGRTLTITGTGSTIISGVISNFNGSGIAGGLIKSGTGVLTLSGANLYTGPTSLDVGTLLVNNSTGSAIGSGNLTAAASTVFGGIGSISGSLTTSGSISPGSFDASNVSMIGQLTVGTLTANTGSSLFLQVGGATLIDADGVSAYLSSPSTFAVPASWTNSYESGTTQHDQLYVSGSASPTLNSTITVSSSFLNSYNPSYGAIFQVVDWASLGTNNIAGTQTFNLPALTGGLSWNTDLFKSYGVLMVVGVVPEPSRLLLVMLGLLLVFARRRRR
ncbi:beta strand repeat-containing protein [Prosthecobacter debontii]|uniref:beta strand repeat-containing protein n=1 Tax=Prosthecobacter debontii TaxID=48467 RepID=UPI001592314E|nr:autotransporter-associated beta strand repeat-containing protein [Prosthecobacter debontii]